MKGRRSHSNVLGLMVLSLFIFHFRPCFAQDFQRLSERTLMGTARYVSMCGAMSAIGGDPTSALDNPAGLGLYRHSEALLTFDYTYDKTQQQGSTLQGRTHMFMVPQASLVFFFPTPTVDGKGVQSHTLMFTYNRLQSYGRLFDVVGENSPSLGALLKKRGIDIFGIPYNTAEMNKTNGLFLRESGYVNEYALAWAINVSNRFYWGIGLNIHSYVFSNEATYDETFAGLITISGERYNTYMTSLFYSGADCAFSTGFLYRPASWVRLGFGIQTPSLGAYNSTKTDKLETRTDSVRFSPMFEDRLRVSDYHQPLHTSTSVAFQIGYYGMIALQYDYRYTPHAHDVHSLRAGVEVIPVAGLYINAGYAYESMFRKQDDAVPIDQDLTRQHAYFQYTQWSQYVSAGIGYRGTNFIAQLAYQYRWQRINLYAHESAMNTPYVVPTDAHRIVLTIGWHK